jgi:hypothetical protein
MWCGMTQLRSGMGEGVFVKLIIDGYDDTVAAVADNGLEVFAGMGGLNGPLMLFATVEAARSSQRFGCSFVCRPLQGQDFCGNRGVHG